MNERLSEPSLSTIEKLKIYLADLAEAYSGTPYFRQKLIEMADCISDDALDEPEYLLKMAVNLAASNMPELVLILLASEVVYPGTLHTYWTKLANLHSPALRQLFEEQNRICLEQPDNPICSEPHEKVLDLLNAERLHDQRQRASEQETIAL